MLTPAHFLLHFIYKKLNWCKIKHSINKIYIKFWLSFQEAFSNITYHAHAFYL